MGTHLLTGATSGIGREVAHRLSERGEHLVLVVRDPARAVGFPDAEVLVADLAQPESVFDLDLPPRLDSVVHAAGAVQLGGVGELDAAAWRTQLDVNLLGPALLTRACLPALREAAGTVVFVNSGAGLSANPDWSAYAASKFGLRALADSLRAEEPAIRVTSVFPGRTATAMQEAVHAQEGKEYDAADWIQPGTVADAVLGVIELSEDASVPELVIRPRG